MRNAPASGLIGSQGHCPRPDDWISRPGVSIWKNNICPELEGLIFSYIVSYGDRYT